MSSNDHHDATVKDFRIQADGLQNAAEVLADRAKALSDAIFENDPIGNPHDRALRLLVMACKRVVVSSWAAAPAVKDEALAAYARRICIEQHVDPDTLVICEAVPVADLMGESSPIAFTAHLPRIEPAWVRVYRRLPSMENLEGDKLSHVRGPFGDGCDVCGATREEFADGLMSPYACPGPCTEVRMLWIYTNSAREQQCWQAPATDGMPPQRYMRHLGLDGSVRPIDEADFERWKLENTP